MKWKIFKLMLPLLFMVFVLPMIMPGPKGRPVMTWQDWLPNAASIQRWQSELMSLWNRTATNIEQKTGLDVAPAPAQLYKWKDEHGKWHFTDRADMASKSATREHMPATVNSMAPPPVIPRSDETESAASSSSLPLPLPTTVPVDKIPQLIDDAKKLQKISDERTSQLDDL